MGSKEDKDEFTVLVTGFGPFRQQYPVNPSWEIASRLPSHLPPLRAKDLASRPVVADDGGGGSSSKLPAVRILVHPEPIRVSYRTVRELVPSFWEDEYGGGGGEGGGRGRRIDAVVHIGMASSRPVYLLERLAHRTGYKNVDVDGEMLEDEVEGGDGDEWIWKGLPDELESEYDIPNVYLRWKELCCLPGMDVRLSADAGRYLCDFIYYSSLSTLFKQKRPGKVCFLHVPADASDEAVERGREIAINLIRSVAESEIAEKQRSVT